MEDDKRDAQLKYAVEAVDIIPDEISEKMFDVMFEHVSNHLQDYLNKSSENKAQSAMKRLIISNQGRMQDILENMRATAHDRIWSAVQIKINRVLPEDHVQISISPSLEELKKTQKVNEDKVLKLRQMLEDCDSELAEIEATVARVREAEVTLAETIRTKFNTDLDGLKSMLAEL